MILLGYLDAFNPYQSKSNYGAALNESSKNPKLKIDDSSTPLQTNKNEYSKF